MRNRTMRSAAAGLAVASLVVMGLWLPAPARAQDEVAPLGLRVELEHTTAAPGAAIAATVTLTNRSDDPLVLVQPGDGSAWGWRTPVVGWSVLPVGAPEAHPAEPPRPGGGRCGNINPLKPDEVVELAPGGSLALRWVPALRAPAEPGRYRVIFYYRNDPDHAWHGLPLGSHDAATMQRVRESTRCGMRSDEIIITVRAD